MAAIAVPMPGEFQIEGGDIEKWLDEVENYTLAACGVVDDARKKAIVIACIGSQARLAIRNFQNQQTDTYEHLCETLIEHYKEASNVIVERHIFYTMTQEVNESIEAYETRLTTQARKCEFVVPSIEIPAVEADVGNNILAVPPQTVRFEDISEQMIRDRIVVGIQNKAVQRRLLRERGLTLRSAVDMLKSVEMANLQAKMYLANDSTAVVDVVRSKFKTPPAPASAKMNYHKPQISSYGSGSNRDRVSSSSRGSPTKNENCKFCGYKHKRGSLNCPAYEKTCDHCGGLNHFKSVCFAFQRQRKQQYRAEEVHADMYQNSNDDTDRHADYHDDDDDDLDALYIGHLTVSYDNNIDLFEIENINCKDWIETIKLNNHKLDCKIDTGAQANVMSMSTLNSIDKSCKLNATNVRLNGYGGHKIPTLGTVNLNCILNNTVLDTKFIIVPLDVKTIIGLDTSSRLKLVTPRCGRQLHTTSQHPPKELGCNGKHNQLGSTTPQHENVYSVAHTPPTSTTHRNGNSDLNRLLDNYSDVFDETKLGCMKQHPYNIRIEQNAEPKVHAPRKVPFAIRDDVEKELEKMLRIGAIAKVDGPTDWVNSMVVVKKDKGIRICLDPGDLNKAVRREHTQLPSPDEALAHLTGAKVFSKVDLKNGYWQVPLTESSSYLTTFNTPVGRYRYTRLPFGLNSANEVFQKRVSQAYENLTGVLVIFDDILIYGKDRQEHDRNLEQCLKRTQEQGIQLNRGKCRFYADELKYIGHIISKDGVKPDPEKVQDILNMPAPQDRAAVQRLLGMVTYLAKFIPQMSQVTQPIRVLLNKDTHFEWSYEQAKAFNRLKQTLTSEPVLAFYDVRKDIELHTDASEYGLGATIIQEGKPVAYASRSLTDTERKYAQIEKELLSIVFGCERFNQYLYAKNVTVYTDHKPLVAKIDKPVNTASARLQRLFLRLQKYSLHFIYKPGKLHVIPDTLSRACVTSYGSDEALENEIELMIDAVVNSIEYPDKFKQRICEETETDPCLKEISKYLENKWPVDINKCDENARLYWSIRHELKYYKGMILFNDRIVIPKVLQAECLKRLHTAHLGRVKCKAAARKGIYWRNINANIDSVVDKCEICLAFRNNPSKEPLISHELPERPFQKVAADICTIYGKKYQIVVDYFSKWPEVLQLTGNPNSNVVVKHMKTIFSRFGIPEIVFSDQERIYESAEFASFCREYDIKKGNSSARWAQSNGQVERTVQTVKKMIKKCLENSSDINLALLQYRNTPLDENVDSPSRLLLGRDVRTNVPCISEKLKVTADIDNRKLLHARQVIGKKYYDRTAGKERPQFTQGQIVAYRDSLADSYYKSGLVLSSRSQRSCTLLSDKGNVITRNNRMLLDDRTGRQFTAMPDDMPESSEHVVRFSREREQPAVAPQLRTGAIAPAQSHQPMNSVEPSVSRPNVKRVVNRNYDLRSRSINSPVQLRRSPRLNT